jgi:ribosomal protein S18 acetylase RimI-like enzyme
MAASPPGHRQNAAMGTQLRPMTEADYERFRETSIREYAQANIDAGRWPVDAAVERSRDAYERLLPKGLKTPGQHLFCIHDDERKADVGVLWLAVTEQPGGSCSGYVYDVAIDAAHRRQGHARAAFLALEAVARDMGLAEIGLHVFWNNEGAQALYRSLGYEPTGINMHKKLG